MYYLTLEGKGVFYVKMHKGRFCLFVVIYLEKGVWRL